MVTVWQVAAGSVGRDYSDRFLSHGIAFVGDQGEAAMKQVHLGDTMILKGGVSQILAVGRVAARNGKFKDSGDKDRLKDFDG
jgi:hypothetical protein